MLIVTTDSIPGKNYEIIGIVEGSTVQSVHIGKDIMNSFKTLVGGELTSYNDMMNSARKLATERMIQNAQELNADAIVYAGSC